MIENNAVLRASPVLARHLRRPVIAQDALERGAETGDRRAAAFVAFVGGQGDPVDVPLLEGVGEQEQLGLGVDGGALDVGGQPRAADLDLVRLGATAPPPQLHEPACTRRHVPIGDQALGERHGLVAVTLGRAATPRIGAIASRVAGTSVKPYVDRSMAAAAVELVDERGRQRDELDVAADAADRSGRRASRRRR